MKLKGFLNTLRLFCLLAAFCVIIPDNALGKVLNQPRINSRLLGWSRPFRLGTNGPAEKFIAPPEGLSIASTSPSLLDGDHNMVEEKVEIEQDLRRVRITRVLGSRPYGLPTILNLDDLLDISFRENYRSPWRKGPENRPREVGETGRGGALEINIPVKFPKAISQIIGQGSALKISGMRRISFSGRSEWTTGQVQTAISRPSKFPSLNMEQKSRFTIEGTIGERIHIQVDQDSERQGDIGNAIRIRYDGDEDRIIQEIEAGNTTLSLPGTRFVGFSSRHKGLFGIRTKGKLGGFDFTAIASQEKTSGQRKTFRGLAEESKRKIRDYQYLEDTYFFVDLKYRDRFRDGERRAEDSIAEIRVYVDDLNVKNDAEKRAVFGRASFDLENPEESFFHEGNFHELDPAEYFLDPDVGYIVLSRSIRDEHVLAVAYRTAGGETFGDVKFDLASGDPIRLKLIKARNQRPEDPTWDLEWKNVYDLGSREVNPDGLEIRIFKELPGSAPDDSQDGVPYIRILGLDRHDRYGRPTFDNIVDLDPAVIDLGRGELIFPDLQPFAPLDPEGVNRRAQEANPNLEEIPGLKDTVPDIYKLFDNRRKAEASKYFIEVKTKSRQTRFNLNPFGGVLEGSEEVILNGKRLRKGEDYSINYLSGDITFFTDEVRNPAAELIVHYDVPELSIFASQQKTLLGTRGEYKFWGNSSLGSTVLYNSQRSAERRVRVGEEPARTIIWDTDAKLRFQPKFLTSVVNALPFLETEAPSNLNIEAEIAQSLPNPNTKGAGFIDDFEGSRNRTSLGVSRGIWTRASVPDGKDASNTGRLIWYNPFERVPVREIWPNRDVSAQENLTDVLVLEFSPDEKATYLPPPSGPSEEAWGGVMRALAVGGADFSRSKFIEVWVRGDEGILNIDLGSISEDAIPNGVLDSEDKLVYGQRNNKLDVGEDVGLDGLSDEDEPGYDPVTNPDPNGDNWSYSSRNRNDYSRINGTEDSKDDPEGGLTPDTEDINRSGFLDKRNDYYHYSIDLSQTRYLVPDTENEGWRLFRIPLWRRDVYPADGLPPTVGNPDPTLVEFARVWVTGVPEPTRIEIASLDVVGNNWLEDEIIALGPGHLTGLEKFDITVKSTDQNKDYKQPPGVKVRRDPFTGVREREQSLVLKFEELGPGVQVSASRIFPQRANYTDYTGMRMYVHGDPLLTDVDTSSVELFIRFGPDTTNYYEYSTKVYPNWDSRNEVDVDLEFISNLKGVLLDALTDSTKKPEVPGYNVSVDRSNRELKAKKNDGEKVYKVRGNPALSNIKTLTIGVFNRGDFDPISGEIWVDELRLDDVRREVGTAAGLSLDSRLADLMNVGLNLTWREDDFSDFRSPKGSGSTQKVANFRGSMNLDRFFPLDWGASIPLSFSWESSSSLPRLKTGSDVVLNEEQRKKEGTKRDRMTANVSFRKKAVSSNPLASLTLDRMNANFSITQEKGLSPQRPESENYLSSGSFSYNLSPRKRRSLKLFGKTEFRYLPSKLSYSANVNRRKSRYVDVDRSGRNPRETEDEDFILSENYDAKVDPFQSFSADYGLRIKRDLRDNLDLGSFKLGREVDRTQTANLKLNLDLFSWLRQNYSFKANYHENNDPKLLRGGRDAVGRDVDSRSSASARFTFGLPSLLRSLGKLGGKSEGSVDSGKPGEVEEGEDARPSKRGFSIFRAISTVGDRMSSVNGSYTRTSNFRIFGLLGRPSLSYQLGISEEPGVEIDSTAVGMRRDSKSISDRISLDTGLKLPSNLSLKTKYEYEQDRREVYSKSPIYTRAISFPSLTGQWGALAKLPFLKGLVTSSSLNFSCEKETSKRGEEGLEPENLLRKSDTISFSPLFSWTTRWKGGLRTTFKSTRRISKEEDWRDGELRGVTRSTSNTFTVTFDYSINASKGFSIPGFGKKIKLKSDIDVSLDITRGASKDRTGRSESELVPRRDESQWAVRLQSSYRFSRKFTGGAKVVIENRGNNLTDTTRKVREVGFWGEIRFN